ncbi:hypothetical protein HYR99_17150 [Candidatus Poribacteria bacterium]|nr:hypothetical protein [Candidatus Poribacteria bacterium]
MASAKLKKKIHDVLKKGYFSTSSDFVDVSDGYDDLIHIVVVSRKFDGRRMKEKEDLIWAELYKNLSEEEWGKVSLSVGTSPDEIKSL